MKCLFIISAMVVATYCLYVCAQIDGPSDYTSPAVLMEENGEMKNIVDKTIYVPADSDSITIAVYADYMGVWGTTLICASPAMKFDVLDPWTEETAPFEKIYAPDGDGNFYVNRFRNFIRVYAPGSEPTVRSIKFNVYAGRYNGLSTFTFIKKNQK